MILSGIPDLDTELIQEGVLVLSGDANSGKTSLAVQLSRIDNVPMVYFAGNMTKTKASYLRSISSKNSLFLSGISGEDIVGAALTCLSFNNILVVVDDIHCIIPSVEVGEFVGTRVAGAQARLLSFMCQEAQRITKSTGSMLVVVSQSRDFDNLGFLGSTLIRGSDMVVFLKRKSPPGQSSASVRGEGDADFGFKLTHGNGVNQASQVLSLLVDSGVVRKAGAYYYLKSGTLVGTEDAVAHVSENMSDYSEAYKSVMEGYTDERHANQIPTSDSDSDTGDSRLPDVAQGYPPEG